MRDLLECLPRPTDVLLPPPVSSLPKNYEGKTDFSYDDDYDDGDDDDDGDGNDDDDDDNDHDDDDDDDGSGDVDAEIIITAFNGKS